MSLDARLAIQSPVRRSEAKFQVFQYVEEPDENATDMH